MFTKLHKEVNNCDKNLKLMISPLKDVEECLIIANVAGILTDWLLN
jgi:hypothetical protein